MASQSVEFGLRYTSESAEYLKRVQYQELVQWLAAETLVAVAKARVEEDELKLSELENVSKFMMNLVRARIDSRNQANMTLQQDLDGLQEIKSQAMDKGVHTKWSSRPGTAGSSRPGTAMPSLGGGGDGDLRPGTAMSVRPFTASSMEPIDVEILELRGKKRDALDALDKAQLKAVQLRERLGQLKKRQEELEAVRQQKQGESG